MGTHKPNTKQDLAPLRCWFYDRLITAILIVPVIVFFLTYLSYLLLSGSFQFAAYINNLGELPMELKEVKTILHGFTSSCILINFGIIVSFTLMTPLLFGSLARKCLIAITEESPDNTVRRGIKDFLIRDNSDVKYTRRRWNILKFWKTKFPKTMVLSAVLFWLILFSISVCVTQFITGNITAMMLLNLPVVALCVYILRLITDKDLFLVRFYISTYDKLLPETAEDAADEDDEGGAEDDFSSEAWEGDGWGYSGEAGGGASWETMDNAKPTLAAPAATESPSGDNVLGDSADDIVLGIDDMDTQDNCFGGDDLLCDYGEDSE